MDLAGGPAPISERHGDTSLELRRFRSEDHPLPFNKLHVPQDLSVDTCHAINDLLRDSLVETCGVNHDDYFCLVSRYSAEDTILHPTFLGKRDPASTIVIEIALLDGRSDEHKEASFKDVRRRLRGINFNPENSIIFLIENRPIDWSFSNGGLLSRCWDFETTRDIVCKYRAALSAWFSLMLTVPNGALWSDPERFRLSMLGLLLGTQFRKRQSA